VAAASTSSCARQRQPVLSTPRCRMGAGCAWGRVVRARVAATAFVLQQAATAAAAAAAAAAGSALFTTCATTGRRGSSSAVDSVRWLGTLASLSSCGGATRGRAQLGTSLGIQASRHPAPCEPDRPCAPVRRRPHTGTVHGGPARTHRQKGALPRVDHATPLLLRLHTHYLPRRLPRRA
jgi:hypothetical protein